MAAFVRVVEADGFSAAAPQLGLTPSAVSKLITRLEDRLGVRLLQRTTRTIRLTEEGRAYFEAARRIVAEIEEAEAQAAQRSAAPRGLLRVTASVAFGTHQIAPIAPEFLARHPGVTLDLLFTDRMVDLVEEAVDVALRTGQLADSSLIARKLGEDRRVVCAAPSYLAAHGEPRTPDDLRRHNCLVFRDRPHLNHWPFAENGRVREIQVSGNCQAGDGEILYQLALHGVGVCRLTRLTVAAAIREGRLVPILEGFDARSGVPIHAVYPHRRHLAPKVSAFIEFLIERFSPPPWEA